jgi:chromosome segregation ATPase
MHERALGEREGQLTQARGRVRGLEAETETLRDKARLATTRAERLDASLHTATQQAVERGERLRERDRELQGAQGQVSRLAQELASYKAEATREARQMEKALMEGVEERDLMRDKTRVANTKADRFERALHVAQQEASEAQQRASSLEEELAAYKVRAQEAEARGQERQREMEGLRGLLGEQEAMIQQLRREREEQEATIAALRSEMDLFRTQGSGGGERRGEEGPMEEDDVTARLVALQQSLETPVSPSTLSSSSLMEAAQRLREEVEEGRQALISRGMGRQAARDIFEEEEGHEGTSHEEAQQEGPQQEALSFTAPPPTAARMPTVAEDATTHTFHTTPIMATAAGFEAPATVRVVLGKKRGREVEAPVMVRAEDGMDIEGQRQGEEDWGDWGPSKRPRMQPKMQPKRVSL